LNFSREIQIEIALLEKNGYILLIKRIVEGKCGCKGEKSIIEWIF